MANIKGANAMDEEQEKIRQELCSLDRSSHYMDYNSILAFFQA